MKKIKIKRSIKIFSKRFVKYMIILMIFIGMLTPLITNSYDLGKSIIIENNTVRLNEGIQNLEKEIAQVKQIGDVIAQEEAYQRLLLLRGKPSPQHYADIRVVQKKFSKICLTQGNAITSYLMFKDNPIFISNSFSSDDYEKVYPDWINYQNKSIEDWRGELFNEKFSFKFLPSSQIYDSYYRDNTFNGITCIVNNSIYDGIVNTSIITSVFKEEDIIDSMLYPQQKENSFLYIVDSNNKIILSSNYKNNKPLESIDNQTKTIIDNEAYIVIKSISTRSGLNAVIGLPVEQLQKNITSMINLVNVYAILGMIIGIILAVILSLRETISFNNLIEIATTISKDPFTMKNEFSYITNTILGIDEVNKEQINKVNQLNKTVQRYTLEKSLMLGVHTKQEEEEVLKYFNNKFEYFAVAILKIKIDKQKEVDKQYLPSLVVKIENELQQQSDKEYLLISNSEYELIMTIFYEKHQPRDEVKQRLEELICSINRNIIPQPLVNIGLSQMMQGVKKVREAYVQAKHMIDFYEDFDVSRVYVYETSSSGISQQSMDISIFMKCYELILVANKEGVSQLFDEIESKFLESHLHEEEKLQVFFSIRQPIYNAYSEVIKDKIEINDKEVLDYLNYNPLETVKEFMTKFKQCALVICKLIEENKKSKNNRLKKEIIEYIERNYMNPNLSAVTIAEEMFISEKYVFSIVKEYTSKPLGKFIESIRLQKAEELLLTTDYTNAKIIKLTGFGSENTYYRAFTKKHGMSPTIWKKVDCNR